MSEKLTEIPAGKNLVAIIQANTVWDLGKRIKTPEGDYMIVVRFSTGDNKCHDETFCTSNPGFKHLCNIIDADLTKPICPELIGKRLWLKIGPEGFVDFIKCENPLFVSDGTTEVFVGEAPKQKAKETTKEQQEKLNIGKKIIEDVMKKDLKSLNQKNNLANVDFGTEDHKIDVDDKGVVNKVTITNHGSPSHIDNDWDNL